MPDDKFVLGPRVYQAAPLLPKWVVEAPVHPQHAFQPVDRRLHGFDTLRAQPAALQVAQLQRPLHPPAEPYPQRRPRLQPARIRMKPQHSLRIAGIRLEQHAGVIGASLGAIAPPANWEKVAPFERSLRAHSLGNEVLDLQIRA